MRVFQSFWYLLSIPNLLLLFISNIQMRKFSHHFSAIFRHYEWIWRFYCSVGATHSQLRLRAVVVNKKKERTGLAPKEEWKVRTVRGKRGRNILGALRWDRDLQSLFESLPNIAATLTPWRLLMVQPPRQLLPSSRLRPVVNNRAL